MMMPANFSAIAETEMTYVVGGGLEDYLAPVMTTANWQTFNTNLVTIIGNTYMGGYIANTLGTLFSGAYVPGQITGNFVDGLTTAYNGGYSAALKTKDSKWTSKLVRGANGVLNAGLNVVGNLAAIYTLGHGSAASYHTNNVLTVNG